MLQSQVSFANRDRDTAAVQLGLDAEAVRTLVG
jgi:hypothetical protein